MPAKLNSMRLLEQHKIPYEVVEFPDTMRDAEEIAEVLGAPPFLVYKTLVVEPEGSAKPFLVMIAANRQLDLKRLAAVAGAKKVHMAAHKDAEALTGLKVGGISALALTHKNWIGLPRPARDRTPAHPDQRGAARHGFARADDGAGRAGARAHRRRGNRRGVVSLAHQIGRSRRFCATIWHAFRRRTHPASRSGIPGFFQEGFLHLRLLDYRLQFSDFSVGEVPASVRRAAFRRESRAAALQFRPG